MDQLSTLQANNAVKNALHNMCAVFGIHVLLNNAVDLLQVLHILVVTFMLLLPIALWF